MCYYGSMKRFFFFLFFFAATSVAFSAHAAPLLNPAWKYGMGMPLRVLIVPGHDNDYAGAVYDGVREADMTLALGASLAQRLSADPQLEVTLARTGEGYLPELATYFTDEEDAISEFIDEHKTATNEAIEEGNIEVTEQVPHNTAPGPVALRLYGINKWLGEQGYDLVIHIHFNDDGERKWNERGDYRGYTVYVPETGLPNAPLAHILGDAVGYRMDMSFAQSTMPLEAEKANEVGTVPDFTLVALGSNRTLDIPSILVEYSYLYESLAHSDIVFPVTKDVMARATEIGIHDFLRGRSNEKNLSYTFEKDMKPGKSPSRDVAALQYALIEEAVFPPLDAKDPSSCVVDGVFGDCTTRAVKAFQSAHGLSVDGVPGAKTRQLLNQLFGV